MDSTSECLSSLLGCTGRALIALNLVDPSVTGHELLESYSAEARHRALPGRNPMQIAAEFGSHHGASAESRSLWSWRRIRAALADGAQPVVLLAGLRYGPILPGLRPWSWPWHPVLVTGFERRGLLLFVHVSDPSRPDTRSDYRIPLFVFKRARTAGMVSVLFWRYLFVRTADVRERVPYPWPCLLFR